MNPIEPGIEISGHGAIQKIDNDLAGRRWFNVVRSDRRAGIDDHDRRALGSKLARDLLGLPFGALIMVAHLRLGHGRILISREDVAANEFCEGNATDRACINNAGTFGSGSHFDYATSALDVRGIHAGVISEPEVVTGGYMEAPIAAG